MPYTDWTNIVDEKISLKNKLSILEFGLGDGTEYLINNFKLVYSYELIDERDHTLINWYEDVKSKHENKDNWLSEVAYWNDTDFIDYDPNLSRKLTDRIDYLFNIYEFDCVLMDGGFHVRGDIVNYIINKFYPSYVIIHDTNYNFNIDGYDRIKLPDNYITFKSDIGEGTYIYYKQQ